MINKEKLKFSVITSVYKSDVPEYVRTALESTFNQTLVPDEVVCVADGPIPDELKAVVEEFHTKYPEIMHPLYLEKNGGLGEAMRIASLEAKYDYLARMDSDDICMPDRFEKQMRCFEEDPDLSIVGGMITEFEGEPENVFAKRILPLEDVEIKKMMPEVEYPMITVITTYSGAAPESVEKSITKPIEEALTSVTGVKELTSQSSEGFMKCFFTSGYSTNERFKSDMKLG